MIDKTKILSYKTECCNDKVYNVCLGVMWKCSKCKEYVSVKVLNYLYD